MSAAKPGVATRRPDPSLPAPGPTFGRPKIWPIDNHRIFLLTRLYFPDQAAATSPNDDNSGGNGSGGNGGGDVAGQPAAALGLTLSRITPDVRQQFEIPDSVKGVVVVDAGGPTAAQGIQPGDVIEQVAQKDVTTQHEVQSLAQEARAAHRNAVLLLVNRHGNEICVAVKFA